jgi:hypothetical protein
VAPIWASSPAAWTAVVTISVPRGGPLGRPSGGGGGTRRGAGFGGGATRFVGLTLALAFAFVAARFDGAAFAFAVVAAGFEDFAFEAFAGFAALVRPADARRSPPMRVGRVERRLPRTPDSDARLADFLAFFFADFWLTRFEA